MTDDVLTAQRAFDAAELRADAARLAELLAAVQFGSLPGGDAGRFG